MPALRKLYLSENEASSLPESLGRGLPRLEEVHLEANLFTAVPVAALTGATALTKIEFRGNEGLGVEQPLGVLLELSRLRFVRLWKRSGSWSRASGMNLVALASRLGARDPRAPAALLAEEND